ncbi:VPLPA-CTERM sorting domain-containing protein [Parvularcula sp. ZS-1/3]|uniref:VPLPA-CTERM sorting domain-containing protein n=1 Tax=Parvularcula mediterranea TaxID=2732508 RepID=A0A7Y3W507_9PROT|nr:VPLPA-CTERM sorting domain-containing protein [Parvularcula mediterranea]NNU16028.1 VPLPA-CTERM sorting domain-containing protein [Parvularcula mediterranea]
MELKNILAGVAASAVLATGSAFANTIIVDDFDTAQSVEDASFGDGSETDGPVAANVNWNRTVEVEAFQNGPVPPGAGASVRIGNSVAAFSGDSNVGFLSTLTFAREAGTANFDLPGFNERFQVDVLSADGTATFTFGLEDVNGNISTTSQSIEAADLGVTEFLFSDLMPMVGGGVDITQIVGLFFEVEGDPEFDLTIDLIGVTDTAIPLPAGAPLLASALAGFAAFRRFRKN